MNSVNLALFDTACRKDVYHAPFFSHTPQYESELPPAAFFCILIPALATTLLFATLSGYFIISIQKQFLARCEDSNHLFASNYDQIFLNIHQSSRLLFDNPTFKSTYNEQDETVLSDYYLYETLCNTLSSFSNTSPYIRHVGFIATQKDRYISSEYTTALSDYYGNPYYGTIVNAADYIRSYDFEPRNRYLQFQPLDVYMNTAVLPMLQYMFGNYKLPTPLIYYLDQGKLCEDLDSYKSTGESQLIIYCPATAQVIASTSLELSEMFLSAASGGNLDSYHGRPCKLFGRKYYCYVTSGQNPYADSLVYITLVPNADIFSSTIISWLLSALTIGCCGVLTSILTYRFASKLYHPIQKLVDNIPADSTDIPAGNELICLENHLQNLRETNTQLNSNMTHMLPILYNKYIQNIIQDKGYENRKLMPMLSDYQDFFSLPFFVCGMVISRFTNEYDKDFDALSQEKINLQLGNILGLSSGSGYTKYVFQLQKNEFCIIYNLKVSDCRDILEKDYHFLQSPFSFDKDYISLYISFGGTTDSLFSISDSWKQASQAMSQMSLIRDNQIAFWDPQIDTSSAYLMWLEDDTHLTIALLKGDFDAVSSILEEVVEQNQRFHTSVSGMRDLYLHLYEIGDQAILRKGSSAKELMGDKYVPLGMFVNSFKNIQKSDYIVTLYREICTQNEPEKQSSFNLPQLKEYVDNHCFEEIYLESIAENFNTSPKYMSKLLKQALGCSFKQYITQLRMEKAKQLLLNSDMSIEEISTACGFSNRNNFTRTFRQLNGCAPTEWRQYSQF